MTPSPRDPSHARFEELSVGYALAALEPEDEERAVAHLRTCTACRAVVDASHGIAGEMAFAVPLVNPPASLWSANREALPDAAFAGPDRSAPAPTLTPVPAPAAARWTVPAPRPRVSTPARHWQSLVGAAAAVALIVGLGAWNVSLRDGGEAARLADNRAVVLRLIEQPDTVRVTLSDPKAAVQGAALLSGGKVWLVMDGLAPNDTANTTYVLWRTDHAGGVTAVAPFDLSGGTTEVVEAGPVGADRADVTGFAVTLEKGRTMPERPGAPTVVTGSVSGA